MSTPTVNSLIVAERVYRDIDSKKWIISGVFNTLAYQAFPAKHDWMEAFFQITNIESDASLRFRIENAETGSLIVDFGGPIESPSPLDVLEKKITLRGVIFPSAGKYWVQLVSDEAILCQAPLFVRAATPPPMKAEPAEG